MYKGLFIDTETTGLFNKKSEYNDVSLSDGTWPYITQLAFKVVEFEPTTLNKCFVLDSYCEFIFPEWDIKFYSKEAQDKTGISYSYLQSSKVTITSALEYFIHWLSRVDFVVSHNTYFDMKVIKAELLRHGFQQHLRIVPWLDTVYYGSELLSKLNTPNRYPRLGDLYTKIYDSSPLPLHDASNDVQVLLQVFTGLIRHNIITPSRLSSRLSSFIPSNA